MGTIAVLIPAVDRWFLREVAAGAEERAALSGHAVVVSPVPIGAGTEEFAAARIEDVFAMDDGLGAIAGGLPYQGRGGDRMLTWRKPVVIIGGSVMGFPVVSFDDVGIGRSSTQHLLDLAHRRIAHVTESLDRDRGFVFLRRRARGYRMAMEAAGLTADVLEGVLGTDAYVSAIESLLTRPDRPTAVVAGYDEIAFLVLDVAQRLGIQVGTELSVVVVNGHPDAETRDLTTTRFRPREVGATAVEMILDGITPGTGQGHSRLHLGSFIPRGSSGQVRT